MFKRLLIQMRESRKISQYQEIISRLTASATPTDRIYRDIREIEVVFPNIDVYTQRLQQAHQTLLMRTVFPNSLITPSRISVGSFYLGNNGVFLNVQEAHEQFVVQAVGFLTTFEERDDMLDITEMERFALSRLSAVVDNLSYLSQALQT